MNDSSINKLFVVKKEEKKTTGIKRWKHFWALKQYFFAEK